MSRHEKNVVTTASSSAIYEPMVGVGLSASDLELAFPFHLGVDRYGEVVQVGPVLARLMPELEIGSPFDLHFRVARPSVGSDPALLRKLAPSFVVLEALGLSFVLRGQSMAVGDHLLLLISPWVTDSRQLSALGLSISDFAQHDPVVDYLAVLQTTAAALTDTTELAHRLSRAKLELESALAQRERANVRLQAVIERLSFGLLAEDESGAIVFANHEFCRLFGIPLAPDALLGLPCGESASQAKALFADPDGFVAGIAARVGARTQVLGEELHLVDGRVFERDYIPFSDAEGRYASLWQYRDVSGQRFAAQRDMRPTGVEGRLEQLGLSSLLMMMEMERMSGVLKLHSAREQATGLVFVHKGRVLQTRIDDAPHVRSGRESLYQMLSWEAGTFQFTATEVEVEDLIQMTTTRLLLESARLADEANRV